MGTPLNEPFGPYWFLQGYAPAPRYAPVVPQGYLFASYILQGYGVPALPADLLEAIVAYTKASALAPSLPGGIYADEAPDVPTYPYLVLSEVGESASYMTGTPGAIPALGEVTFQLSVFATSKSAARNLRAQVVALFQDAPLTFRSGYLMRLRMESRQSLHDPAKGAGAVDVWQEAITYTATVGRMTS